MAKLLRKFVALVLVLGLMVGMFPTGVLAGERSSEVAHFVLPAGEQMSDDDLAQVTGEALPLVLAAVGGYVVGKLADAAWERYVDPWLDETVWPWVDEKLGITR